MTDSNRPFVERRKTDMEENRLEQRVNHIDSRVTGLTEDMASVKATSLQTSHSVDRLVEMHNQSSKQNWPALITTVIALVGIMGAGVTLLVGPLRAEQDRHAGRLNGITEAMITRAYIDGKNDSDAVRIREDFAHHDGLYHALISKVEANSEAIAAAKVSRKAIGDYVQEHVNDSTEHN